MQQTLAVGRKALKLAQAKGDAELIGMINDQLRQSASPLAGTEPPPADQVFRFSGFPPSLFSPPVAGRSVTNTRD
jgi:hypothetical protein